MKVLGSDNRIFVAFNKQLPFLLIVSCCWRLENPANYEIISKSSTLHFVHVSSWRRVVFFSLFSCVWFFSCRCYAFFFRKKKWMHISPSAVISIYKLRIFMHIFFLVLPFCQHCLFAHEYRNLHECRRKLKEREKAGGGGRKGRRWSKICGLELHADCCLCWFSAFNLPCRSFRNVFVVIDAVVAVVLFSSLTLKQSFCVDGVACGCILCLRRVRGRARAYHPSRRIIE